MKKILFISLFFLTSINIFASTLKPGQCWLAGETYYTEYTCGRCEGDCKEVKVLGDGKCLYEKYQSAQANYWDFCSSTPTNAVCFNDSNGDKVCRLNPDPLGGPTCREIFEINGVSYSCNPNTNEYRPNPNNGYYDNNGILNCKSGYSSIDNSQCWENPENGNYDELGNKICNDGYSESHQGSCTNQPFPKDIEKPCPNGWSSSQSMVDGQTKCWPPSSGTTGDGSSSGSGDNPDDNSTGGGIDNGTGGSTGGTGGGSSSGSGNNPDDNSTGGGIDDGTGGSTGGTGGGSSTGGGTNGNTVNEDNNNNSEDTPIDSTPVASSCLDPNLTLQEKLMCEMNEGLKKLNSESSPNNSLNQLAKDIKESNNTNASAINTNIKQTNQELSNINSALNGNNVLIQGSNQRLDDINNNLQDENGNSFLEKISNFFNNLTSPTSDEDKTSYSNQINDKVSNTLNNSFSKYSNILGFGSNYANRPENITITLFNQQYTLIDFSLLDPHVNIIRTLFLTLAYLYGFMNLIRTSK